MYEIPETLAQAQALVDKAEANGRPMTLEVAIAKGMQNWLQELVDEAIEGGYDTVTLTQSGLTITDVMDSVIYHTETITSQAVVKQFKQDAHQTRLTLQQLIRQLVASHIIVA